MSKKFERRFRQMAEADIPSMARLLPSYQKPRRRWLTKWTLAPAMTMLVLMLALGFLRYTDDPFTVLYLEVNPSIQVRLDDQEMVVDIIPLNDDANQLPLTNYLGLNYDEFLNQWLNDVNERGFIHENSVILFDILGSNNELSDQLSQRLETLFRSHPVFDQHPATLARSPMNGLTAADMDEARALGISVMRYHLAQRIAENTPDLEIQEALEMPMRELVDRVPPRVEPPRGRPDFLPPRGRP